MGGFFGDVFTVKIAEGNPSALLLEIPVAMPRGRKTAVKSCSLLPARGFGLYGEFPRPEELRSALSARRKMRARRRFHAEGTSLRIGTGSNGTRRGGWTSKLGATIDASKWDAVSSRDCAISPD